MSAYVELFMDQGATFNSVINLADDTTNLTIDVSEYTIRSQMRRSYYSASPTATLTCTKTDAANGEIVISLTASQTSKIKAGRYLFDLETETPSGVVTRVLEGIITVTPGITR
jgi:hypothetical protein